jgi:hypothetical protein
MNDLERAGLIVYGTGVFVMLLWGFLAYTIPFVQGQEKQGARALILALVWPLAALWRIGKSIGAVWRTADWRNKHGDNNDAPTS